MLHLPPAERTGPPGIPSGLTTQAGPVMWPRPPEALSRWGAAFSPGWPFLGFSGRARPVLCPRYLECSTSCPVFSSLHNPPLQFPGGELLEGQTVSNLAENNARPPPHTPHHRTWHLATFHTYFLEKQTSVGEVKASPPRGHARRLFGSRPLELWRKCGPRDGTSQGRILREYPNHRGEGG